MTGVETNSAGREFELFQQASELPEEERATFLEEACRGEEALRSRVLELLECLDSSSREFLERPAFESREEEEFFVVGERPGDQVGNYTLEELIGEGGFGVVFRAVQVEPLRRKVAVKIIKPGMETKEVVKRFEVERQALAGMDHPSIAKVFDAGTTELGRPYFVMELVEGDPVSEFCNRERLTVNERIELVSDICDAVQHAHEKGIVHRDLKPSNILVRRDGDQYRVKVIDFGVAKAFGRDFTERTLNTALGQVIGTLQYMSPEQSDPGGVEIDCRADVYAIGAILYELLIDCTPLDADRLRQASFDEVLRMIRDEEPVLPSARIRKFSKEQTEHFGDTRREVPERVSRLLRGDLDWIVMKALAKEKGRRYSSAHELSEELHRFLEQMPVSARPPSIGYRLGKIALRHRTVVWSVSLTCLLIATVLGPALMFDATRESKRPGEFASIDTASAPNYMVAAHPYLRRIYGISVSRVVPPGSKLVFVNNLTMYGGDAIDPGDTQNFLTQIDAKGELPSYTLNFSKNMERVSFTRPALFPATESGITHPAWTVTGVNEAGEEVAMVREELIRSFVNVPAKTFTVEATGEVIRSVRVDSNNRLDGVPFAAFDAVLIESLVLDPAEK